MYNIEKLQGILALLLRESVDCYEGILPSKYMKYMKIVLRSHEIKHYQSLFLCSLRGRTVKPFMIQQGSIPSRVSYIEKLPRREYGKRGQGGKQEISCGTFIISLETSDIQNSFPIKYGNISVFVDISSSTE